MVVETKYTRHTYSYLALRRAVGVIGICLPFVLMLSVYIIFKGPFIHESISHYYYTKMGDVFVGAICAVALFLFFYSGYDKWDNWAGNIAGFSALGVALVPTTEKGVTTTAGMIHFAFAAVFFLTLAAFSLFLFTKKAPDPTPQKLKRNKIYIACGLIMLACLAAIIVYFNFFQDENNPTSFVFWAETIALVAFGFSWLTKGETIYPDE